MKEDEQRIFVISHGLVNMSVCAPKNMAIENVESEANQRMPTGISSQWKKSTDENFATGQPNGCDCEKSAERRHWLLNC